MSLKMDKAEKNRITMGIIEQGKKYGLPKAKKRKSKKKSK